MNIKLWWENLSERDQLVLGVGGTISLILIIYLFIWTPLSDAVVHETIQMKKQQSLLRYLQQSYLKIQAFQAGGVSETEKTSGPLLTVVESSLASQQLSSFLQQVQQSQDNQMQLTFQKVPFDKLMRWLQTLWTTNGISVTTFSASRLPVMGIVDAEIILKHSK